MALSVGILNISVAALGVPFVDGGSGTKILSSGEDDSGNTIEDIVFSGNRYDNDHDVIYVPWARLELVKDENDIPKFTFSYSEKGALMTATLRARFARNWKQVAKEKAKVMERDGINRNDISVAPIPVHNGIYQSTIEFEGGGEFIVATTKVQNSIPSNEVAVAMLMGRQAADLVVLALKSPSTQLAYNYKYDFPARTTPYRAKITIHWESVYKYTRRQFAFTHVAGSYQTDKLTRRLIERRDIEILSISGDNEDVYDQLVSDLAKIVVARVFKAHHPKPDTQKLKLPKPQSNWIANFILGQGRIGSGWNVGVSAAYSLAEIDSREQVDETIKITSVPYRTKTATAGIQIAGYCDQYPQLYHYQGAFNPETGNYKIEEGCPEELFGPPELRIKIAQGSVSRGYEAAASKNRNGHIPDLSEERNSAANQELKENLENDSSISDEDLQRMEDSLYQP